MGFNVEPSRIRQLADELRVLEASAGAAARHTSYTDPHASGGAILLRMMEGLNDVESSLRGMFTHLERVLGQSADELVATARDYRRTDVDEAAAADATRRRL